MTAPVVLYAPADGRGKYHAGQAVTGNPVCGDPVLLSADHMSTITVDRLDGAHPLACRACLALRLVQPAGDALLVLEAARRALSLTVTYGGASAARDFVVSRLRRCTNPATVARFVGVYRELERAGA